jgi:hypothetical protein
MIDHVISLAEMGYKVFPLLPGRKHPNGVLVPNGRNDATSDIDRIRAWHKRYPMSNWGLVTDGLVVVDVDGENNPWPVDPDMCADLAGAGAIAVTGRGGRHYFFKQPHGMELKSTTGKLGDHVDTRSNGGYVVLPGSTLTVVGGKAGVYQWVDGCELSTPADMLPEPPQWLVEKLAEVKRKQFSGDPDSREIHSGAIPEGRRNHTLFSLGCALRRIGMSYDEILPALTEANKIRCRPPMDESEIETIAESASKYEPDQTASDMASGAVDDVNIDGIINPPEEQIPGNIVDIPDPGEFPEHLLHVPGFIAKFMELADVRSYRKQPVLALGAAITMQAHLAGRRVEVPGGLRSNIYCLGVAPTGTGKEAARKICKIILRGTKQDLMQLGEGVASHAGFVTAVQQNPRFLWLIDEIGRWLQTVGSPQSAPHLFSIITNLLKMFSSADSLYMSDRYSDNEKVRTIQQPACSLYGTTVAGALHKSITADSIDDGFIGRLFIFEGHKNPEMSDISNWDSKNHLIDELIAIARAWEGARPGDTPEELYTPKPADLIVARFTPDAQKLIADLRIESNEKRMQFFDQMFAPVFARAEEKATKLALIYACSRASMEQITPGNTIEIDVEATKWACELAKYLTNRLAYMCQNHIYDGVMGRKCILILGYIRERTIYGGCCISEINRRFMGIKYSEVREILQKLQSGRFVKPGEIKKLDKRGNPIGNKKVYVATYKELVKK